MSFFSRTTADCHDAYWQVSDIQRILDAAGVDYRDCFERSQLVQRLRENEGRLPGPLASQLWSLQQRQQQQQQQDTQQPQSRQQVHPETQQPQSNQQPQQQHDATQQLHSRQQPQQQQAAPSFAVSALTNLTAGQLAAQNQLFMDEQYVVNLFQANQPSVAHITSLTSTAPSMFRASTQQRPAGQGSGFIWDTLGHVVTNFHVIQHAQQIKVTLYNNDSYEADLVGTEPDKDLAVLRLKGSASAFQPLAVGSSQGLLVGQKTFAIGAPFGLDQTLTAGIVSGLGREVRGITGRVIRDVVQTDAAVNPGNSGGPLLDSRGRLIGVNTMIYSSSGASAGVGFAIPSDTVRRVVNQIIRYGKVVKPTLGVVMVSDQSAAPVIGQGRGVIVREVLPGSSAAQAGLRGLQAADAAGHTRIGDVIIAVGGSQIGTTEDLASAVEQFNVGDQIPLTIRREGQMLQLTVPLK